MKKKKITTVSAALLGLGLLGVTASAAAYHDLNASSGTSWEYLTDIHFAKDWDSTQAGGQKFVQLQGQITGAVSHCIELETTSIDPNPDTRLWISDGSSLTNLNDDFNGTLLSKARVWLGPGVDLVTQVAAYSTGSNSINFRLKAKRLDITEAACTTGQATIPWAKQKIVNGAVTFTFGNGAG
jgi:hypothetical protein